MVYKKNEKKSFTSSWSKEDEMLRQYYGGSSASEEQIARMLKLSNRETPQLRSRSRGLIEGMIKETARQHGKEFEEQANMFIAINNELLSICEKINKRIDAISSLLSEHEGTFEPNVARRINKSLSNYENVREEMNSLLKGENVEEILKSGDMKALVRYCSKLTLCVEKAKKALSTIEHVRKLMLKSQ
jgi:hypothetical protein